MDTKQRWNQVIASKLKEGQSLDDLKKEYDSGIVMEPNIVADEVIGLDHNIDNLAPWINMATIQGSDAAEINSHALQALNFGANGLNIITESSIDLNSALTDVMTEHLDVRIDCTSWSPEAITASRQKFDESKYPNVRWIGNDHVTELHISDSDRVSQIKDVLSQIDVNTQTDIIITLSKNLLFEIASLRALRIILDQKAVINYQIIARYNVEGSNMLGDYDLIEKTYKVMSGIMGSANVILTPFDGSEDARLSLNIHNVLELESGFKDVIDPVGGAYYVEKLTAEIIEKVNE